MEYDWQAHFIQKIEEAQDKGQPVLIMLAGINGAGKSTFYKHYLSDTGYEFINADSLHKEKTGAHAETPNQAFNSARDIDSLIESRISLNHSFIHETLFSDSKGFKLRELKAAEKAGYLVVLFHITLSSPKLALERVLKRVQKDGHDVEREKIPLRFARIPENIEAAKGIVDTIYQFNNDDPEHSYEIAQVFTEGKDLSLPPTKITLTRLQRIIRACRL